MFTFTVGYSINLPFTYPITMATNNQVSDLEFKFLAAFKELGDLPDPDDKVQLQRWLAEHAQAQGAARAAGPPPAGPSYITMPPAPKLPLFSGSSGKDCAFDLWVYEVKCLRDRQPDRNMVLSAVNRSLKGEAARIVMRLGEKASLEEIMAKLHSVYGEVHGTDSVMTNLFNANQKSDETVSEWSVRIEELAAKAVDAGQLDFAKLDSTLRNRFWHGLRPSLRDKTGHKYDAAKSFDQLREELRKVELTEKPLKSASVKAAQELDIEASVKKHVAAALKTELDSRDERMMKSFQAMLTTALQQNSAAAPAPPGPNTSSAGYRRGSGGGGRGGGRGGHSRQYKCHGCGELGHIRPNCPLNK